MGGSSVCCSLESYKVGDVITWKKPSNLYRTYGVVYSMTEGGLSVRESSFFGAHYLSRTDLHDFAVSSPIDLIAVVEALNLKIQEADSLREKQRH